MFKPTLYLIMVLFLASCQKDLKPITNNLATKNELKPVAEKPVLNITKTKNKASEALEFCKKNNLNVDFCILIDMSLHSGVNRFAVWDFKEEKIVYQYLVGHGCGSNSWSSDDSKENPTFSNEDGSHLSALGKYKLSGRGQSEWGIGVKYLMHGFEETNNNALKRFIVFHSWNLMNDEEVYPNGSPEGWGCPTISNNAMKNLDPIIQKSKQPVLMWIYQ